MTNPASSSMLAARTQNAKKMATLEWGSPKRIK